jgi:hypothetical protein
MTPTRSAWGKQVVEFVEPGRDVCRLATLNLLNLLNRPFDFSESLS